MLSLDEPAELFFVLLAYRLSLASALVSYGWVEDSIYPCRRSVYSKVTVALTEFVE